MGPYHASKTSFISALATPKCTLTPSTLLTLPHVIQLYIIWCFFWGLYRQKLLKGSGITGLPTHNKA